MIVTAKETITATGPRSTCRATSWWWRQREAGAGLDHPDGPELRADLKSNRMEMKGGRVKGSFFPK